MPGWLSGRAWLPQLRGLYYGHTPQRKRKKPARHKAGRLHHWLYTGEVPTLQPVRHHRHNCFALSTKRWE